MTRRCRNHDWVRDDATSEVCVRCKKRREIRE
jgi:hypothetical protein